MLRSFVLAILFTGCVSGAHLADGKLYETKATAHLAWNAMPGSWPALPQRTQGLAIALHSKWGEVAQLWGDGNHHTHVLRSDTSGPYGMITAGGLPATFDTTAAVVELELPTPSEPGPILRPSAVRVITAAKAERALDDAAARWQKYLGEQAGVIDRALDAADKASAGRPLGSETTATQDGFMPTWMPADRRFVIVFARTIRRTSQLVEETPTAPCGKRYPLPRNIPGFPEEPVQVSCPQMPRFTTTVHSRSYAVNVALVLEYDASGTRTYERWYEPDAQLAKGPF